MSATQGPMSQSAKNMSVLFQEMRAKEARNHLQPYLKEFKKGHGSSGAGGGDMRQRDLQQLACHWKLNKIPGFWSDNPTEEALLRSLYKHAKKLEAAQRVKQPIIKETRKVSVVVVDPDVETTPANPNEWKDTLRGLRQNPNKEYTGDLFGTRGDYNSGLIYASRRPNRAAGDVLRNQKAPSRSTNDGNNRDGDHRREKMKGKGQQSSALEQLKINSTATLHKLSTQDQYKTDLSNQDAVDAVYRMWKNSINDDVRRNCALTLTNLYTTVDMDRDDVLDPILDLCKTETDAPVLAASAKALLNRMLSERAMDLQYLPAVVAAARNLKAHGDDVTRRNCAQVLRLMLEVARPRHVRVGKEGHSSSKKAEPDPEQLAQAVRTAVLEAAASEGTLSLLAALAMSADDGERQEHATAAMLQLAQIVSVHNDLSSRNILPVIISMLRSPSQATCDNASMLMYHLASSPDEAVSQRVVSNDSVAEAIISVAIAQAAALTNPETAKDQMRSHEQVMAMGAAATGAMLRLSTEPLLLSLMVRGGVADALFSWFRCGEDTIKHHCVVALCNLFACEEGQAALVQLGFVRVLIAAADIKATGEESTGGAGAGGGAGAADGKVEEDVYTDPNVDVGVRKRCSSALCMLSKGGEDLVNHLIEEHAVEALVKLTETIDAEVRLNCVQAIMFLSRSPVSHPAMIQHNAVPVLNKFSKYKDPEVLEACTLALCNLANSEEAHFTLLELDVISTLVRLATVTGLRQQCVSAFCQLSAFRPAHQAIIDQGVLPMLIAQSRFTNAHVRRECAQALYNLTCMVGREADMVAHGVPAALTIVALFRADDGLTKDLCAAALFNLMYDPAGRQQLMDDGVLWAFIKLALAARNAGATEEKSAAEDDESNKDGNADTAETCTRLIRNLACEEAMVKQTVEKRTLVALTKFSSSTNAVTRLNCAMAVCEMARRPLLHVNLLARGGMAVLVGLAAQTRSTTDMSVANAVATVLLRLSQKPESAARIAAMQEMPGVLQDLVQTAIDESQRLLTVHDATVQEEGKKAVLALKRMLMVIACNLSTVTSELASLTTFGLVDVMLTMVNAGGVPKPQSEGDVALADPVAASAILRTMYNLASEPECCAIMAGSQAQAVAAMLNLLAGYIVTDSSGAVYDDAITLMTVSTLVNLTRQAEFAVAAAAQEDSVVMQLLGIAGARESLDLRHACTTAVANLLTLGMPAAYPIDVAMLAAIMSLWSQCCSPSHQHATTAMTICYIIQNIAARGVHAPALVEAGALAAVSATVEWLNQRKDPSITDAQRDALLFELATVMHAITKVEELRPHMFENDNAAVHALMGMALKERPETLQLVAKCLFTLTQTHETRAKLVGLEQPVPFMVKIANREGGDKTTQNLCATALKNLSDDSMLTQSKKLSEGGVVASILRLLPPPEADYAPPSRHGAAEEKDVDLDAVTVRGENMPLAGFPQPWITADIGVATEEQEGVDRMPAGEADWEKIVALEGVPKPLAEVEPEPVPETTADVPLPEQEQQEQQQQQDDEERKHGAGAGAGAGAGDSKRDDQPQPGPLPKVLSKQSFQAEKSPRSILPPLSPSESKGSDQPRARRVAETSQGVQAKSRKSPSFRAGESMGSASLPVSSASRKQRKPRLSPLQQGSRDSGASSPASVEAALWGTPMTPDGDRMEASTRNEAKAAAKRRTPTRRNRK